MTFFHRPCLNTIALTTANVQKAIAIAKKTPCGPRRNWCASKYASGSSKSQKTPRLMSVGVHVSPAPLNDWLMTVCVKEES